MRSPHICPNCGERVSGFAAGCALCGAELDPKRAQGPRSITDWVRSLFTTVRTRPRPRDPVR
jgi:predicted amidophosphoribosyltransferase